MQEKRSFFLTGCASGIGKHVCTLLAREGHEIYATDVNMPALEAAAVEQNWPSEQVRLDKLDVRSYDETAAVFDKAVQAFGKIDVCMNIAGILKPNWVHETPLSEIDTQVDINVKGVMYGTIIASKHMVQRKSGHIINFASLAGVAPIPGHSVYSGTKYAVRGFSQTAYGELKLHNVNVTAVCPDAVDTPLLHVPEKEAAAMLFSGSRLLKVEEIGQLIMREVLPKKPPLACIPLSRTILCRIADLFPALSQWMMPIFIRKGLEHRVQWKGGKAN